MRDLESMIEEEKRRLNSDEKLAKEYKENTQVLAMARVATVKDFIENKGSSIVKK